jgi:hypothetical protein
MADFYATEFVGGPDGTSFPPKKLDGRLVGAKVRRTRATKPASTIAAGDRLYIGKLPAGGSLRAIVGITDTSFATATMSVGTTASPTKYMTTKTLTATDVPTLLGPKATAFDDAPLTTDEDIWITFGTAGVASGVIAAFEMEYTIST